jgi:drug/metabolite transporter (DMT)-like permease
MNSSLGFSQSSWQRWLMIAPFLLWGSAMVVMRDALGETTPLFVAVMRLLPAGLIVLLVRLMMGRQQPHQPWHPRGWQGWLWIAGFALVDGACFQGFLAQGLEETGAGLGSVLIDSQPLAVALMASWFYRERLGVLGWISLLIGLVGIGVIGLSPQWGSGALTLTAGEGWMLLASLSMAVGTVMVRQVSRYADPVIATGWHMILGSLPLIALSACSETHQWDLLTLPHWLELGYAAVLGSALAYALFFYFASQEKLTEFSSLTFLTPIFALLFGGMFLGESLTLAQWIGVGLTLLSVSLMTQRQEWFSRWQRWTSLATTLSTLDRQDLNAEEGNI